MITVVWQVFALLRED